MKAALDAKGFSLCSKATDRGELVIVGLTDTLL